MRPAGLQPDVEQRVPLEQALDLEVRDRVARLVGVERAARRARGGRGRSAPRSGPSASAAVRGRAPCSRRSSPRLAHELPAAARTPPRSARRRAGRRCRGRAGARFPAGPRVAARGRGRGARGRACRSHAPAPGGRRGRPACRRRAGARPRMRCAAARPPPRRPGAELSAASSSTSSPPSSRWLFDRSLPSTRAAPSSSSRSAARASRPPGARRGSGRAARPRPRRGRRSQGHCPSRPPGSRSALPVSPSSERDEQDRHADDDEAVGEVERRPVAQVEEVGHVAEPDAVDQVRGRAADQEAERDRQHRMAGAGAREEDEHPADRDRRQRRHDRRRTREQPEGDPGVLDVVDRERAEHVERVAEGELRARRSAWSAGRPRSPRARPRRALPTGMRCAASERSATETGVSASVLEPTRTSSVAWPARSPALLLALAVDARVVHGSASRRSSPIGWPQRAQMP